MLDTNATSPLAAVDAAHQRVRHAQDHLRATVERARNHGHTWQEIGDVLGTSRQAAFQRFGRPLEPETDAPSGAAVADAVERAIDLLVALTERRWERVRRDFDERMRAAVDVAHLSTVWAQLSGSVGAYEGMDEPFVRQLGEYTVVEVPLHFEAGDGTGRVTFDQDGRVAGLYLLPGATT